MIQGIRDQRGFLMMRLLLAFWIVSVIAAIAVPRGIVFWRNAVMDFETQRLACDIRTMQEWTRSAVCQSNGMEIPEENIAPRLTIHQKYYEIRLGKDRKITRYFHGNVRGSTNSGVRSIEFTKEGRMKDYKMGTIFLLWERIGWMGRTIVIDAAGRVRVAKY